MNSFLIGLLILCYWGYCLANSPVPSITKHGNFPKPKFIHKLHSPKRISQRRRLLRKAGLAPLFPGYGTHYVYVYVGSPPQRQSLIIDTGSYVTAFPCQGCQQCGTHTDEYFNQSASKSLVIPKCLHNQLCQVSQSYVEGSSWHGYKAIDNFWVGDSEFDLIPGAPAFSIPFTFACQTSMTGLFRSQLADGILGLADVEDTLPNQLFLKNVTQTKVFALCFRVGGGILSLGGVDQALHSHRVAYLKMVPQIGGSYGVSLQYIMFREKSGVNHTINEPAAKFSGTKGVLIDSGATDTYLPSSIASSFVQSFKKASGIQFSSDNFKLTEEDVNRMPDIIFGFLGVNNEILEVVMPMSSYIESTGDDGYTFRIFLSEKDGTILGSNFLNNYNFIFDSENSRIGFARSTCNYEEIAPRYTSTPTAAPTTFDYGMDDDTLDDENRKNKCNPNKLIPYTPCSAYCSRNESSYRATGIQDYINECRDGKIVTKECSENCSYSKIVKGPLECPDKAWSDCTHGCIKSRMAVPADNIVKVDGVCNYQYQTAICYSGLCPRQDGDFLIYLDMRVRIEPSRWSYVYTEDFYAAFAQLFKINVHNIELLHNAGNEFSSASKLHFQFRLKAKDYASVLLLHYAADKIVTKCRGPDFSNQLLSSLVSVSALVDGSSLNRFGWLYPSDLEVLSALAIPIGDIRDPFGEARNPPKIGASSPAINTFGYFILGIAVTAIVIIVVLLFLHFKLRQEYALLSKDKSSVAKSSATLKKMWTKFATFIGNTDSNSSNIELSQLRKEQENQMSRLGLMTEHEEDGEVDVY